jgi:hypothetical protein
VKDMVVGRGLTVKGKGATLVIDTGTGQFVITFVRIGRNEATVDIDWKKAR